MQTVKQNIFYVILALLSLPIVFVLMNIEWSTSIIINISGLFGLLFFSFQVLLGIPEVTKIFSSDRISLIRLHTLFGIGGSLAILAHPMSFIFVYGNKFSSLFTLGFSNIFDQMLSLGKISFALLLVVFATSAIIKSKIPYRYWRISHLITYPIVILAYVHAYFLGTFIAGDKIISAWFTSLSLITAFAIFYRLYNLFFGKRIYILTDKKEVSEDVFQYTLVPKNINLKIKAGQFVYLGIKGLGFPHPFTVLSAKENGTIEVCIKKFGKFTSELSLSPLNMEVTVSGPHGIFLQQPGSSRIICIAGGIGITPFLSFVENNEDKEVSLYYFTKNKSKAYFRERFVNALKDKYKEYFSDEARTSAEVWSTELSNTDLMSAEFYICGPQKLTDDVITTLVKKGVNRERILTEQFAF